MKNNLDKLEELKKMPKEKEEVEEPVAKKVYEAKVVDTVTQTAPAVQLPDGTIIDSLELLVMVYNDLQKVKKSVA
jgi:hypothetical protein